MKAAADQIPPHSHDAGSSVFSSTSNLRGRSLRVIGNDEVVTASPSLSGRSGGWRPQFDDVLTVAAFLAIAFVVACAAAPGPIAPYLQTDMRADAILSAPGRGHLFGTDQFGRDVFSLVVYGARPSLLIGVFSVVTGSLIGVSIGLVAGYAGGWLDMGLMRFIDVWMAIPGILLAISVSTALGPSPVTLIIAVGIAAIPRYARVIRGQALAVRGGAFVEAARVAGASHRAILFRHVLPHCAAPIIIMATLGIGGSILVGSGLSFLGLGTNDERPDWGYLLTQGRGYLTVAWWTVTYPGLAITVLVVAVNLVGDALRRRLDPRQVRYFLPPLPSAAVSHARRMAKESEPSSVAPSPQSSVPGPLLRVDRLAVRFGGARPIDAVDRISFSVARGETVCIVGESGSGKTITALSILRLETFRGARIVDGDIVFDGKSLIGLSRRRLDEIRGRRIAIIFQEPMTAFDPVFSIGEQIVETILRHERVGRSEAWERGVRLLERVHVPDARLRMGQIPQQLSGGMRQRAMIAMALACGPDLLIADEPTTALDVTIQAQILALLKELQQDSGMAILLITHDLCVAAEMADRVVVMYAGRIAEQAPVGDLFARPRHPYTRGLLRAAVPHDQKQAGQLTAIGGSIPRLEEVPPGCRFHPRCQLASEQCRREAPPLAKSNERELACWHPLEDAPKVLGAEQSAEGSARAITTGVPLVEVVGVTKYFETGGRLFGRRQRVGALDGVSFAIQKGETFGLVGESGCGKSTLGRVLLQLEAPSRGHVRFDGRSVTELRGRERKRVRRDMQMIFQDPYGSIDPRWTVHDVIGEPLVSHERWGRAALRSRVEELLDLVGLPPSARARYAHEFSGGQRQRIGIARAIALRPRFIVADEAVSALDLSVQAQIINLLSDLRDRLGLTSLFIGHGLNVVRHLSDRIGVMYLGRLVEVASADEVFRRPAHHYSRALLSAIPRPDPRRRRELLAPIGELPSPTAPPGGCHFHPRCPAATERCRAEAPILKLLHASHLVACHHPRA
jgi:peptide/nickel transport system ATP-binding protein